MNKTKIEWADYTWNPIKGMCPVGCWYCYARRIYQRFKLDPNPWLDISELNMTVHSRITGKRVFVCSTFELFHPVADPWRDFIFAQIKANPSQTFIVLTKMPERIDRPMPDNVHLGVSITRREDAERLLALRDAEAEIKFISFEPILSIVPFIWPLRPDWIIAGRMTGHGRKHDPQAWQIRGLIKAARDAESKIFIKNNLRGIAGHSTFKIIQEIPR